MSTTCLIRLSLQTLEEPVSMKGFAPLSLVVSPGADKFCLVLVKLSCYDCFQVFQIKYLNMEKTRRLFYSMSTIIVVKYQPENRPNKFKP